MNNTIKQVIVVRTDLNMRKGKMCAQVAHASMKVFFDRMKITFMGGSIHFENGSVMSGDIRQVLKNINFTDNMVNWMNGSFAKIVVGCNSEQELFDLQKQAEEAGIVNALILDNGNTEFKQICSICNGIGKRFPYNLYNPINKIKFEHECNFCNGTGKINKPTYTCLAIGPDLSDKIDKITGGLKLL